MNDRMEREIRRTIQLLQASMPEPRNRQTPVFTLLRIAAGEINAGLLLGLFAGALIFGLLSVRAYVFGYEVKKQVERPLKAL